MRAHATPDSHPQPRPLTDRQERFIHEYLIDHNASAAAVRAGYSEKNRGTQAAELLKDDRICERIAVELADLFAQLKVNALDLMRRQLNLADLDPSKLFDDDEEAIPLKDLDEDTKRALTVNYEKRRGVMVMKVRQTPRHIALAALWRRFDVMMKMRALALAPAGGAGAVAEAALPLVAVVPGAPRVPTVDLEATPVAAMFRRIREEVRAAREAKAREVEGVAQVVDGAEVSRGEAVEEEVQVRLREAQEEARRAQEELVRLLGQGVEGDGGEPVVEAAEVAGEGDAVEVAERSGVLVEAARVGADVEAVCEVAEGDVGNPITTRVFKNGLPLKGRGPARGQDQFAEEALEHADASAAREAAKDEASDPISTRVFESGLPLKGREPAEELPREGDMVKAAPGYLVAPPDEEACERERVAREQAREAELERDMARLLAREGKAGDAALLKAGPAAWRVARAAAQKLARVAGVRREARQAREAREAGEAARKAAPAPEMKPSLIEHLQRVRAKEQRDELTGRLGGRIAPGVVVGTSGVRPPGYNPPWERDTRPRYAEGAGEFQWSA